MSAEVRIGLAGCGRLAELGYRPAAALVEGARIAAVADPDPERRALLAGEGTAAFESAAELLDAGGVDALVICSPPATHEAIAGLAAEAGITALVEKPPAPDLAGSARIAALDPPPFVGFNRRFGLGHELTNVVPRGGSIEFKLCYRRFSWSPISVRDPALLDLAPHLIDLALRAGIGAPFRVAGRSSKPERVRIEIEGDRARALLDCASERPHRERAVVRDPGGEVLHRRELGGLARGALARLRPGPHPLAASLAAQLVELAGAARGELAPTLATAADGVAVMAVVAAASESLALGGERVPVPDGVAAA